MAEVAQADSAGATAGVRGRSSSLLRNLGFPLLQVHHPLNHFDFSRPGRRILVIGPMGSGKTEFSARMWRDSLVAKAKTGAAREATTTDGADGGIFSWCARASTPGVSRLPSRRPCLPRRLRALRRPDRPGPDSSPSKASSPSNPEVALDSRRGGLLQREARLPHEGPVARRGVVFVCPTLVLNFQTRDIQPDGAPLLDIATDVFPLTAYCEEAQCLADSLVHLPLLPDRRHRMPGPLLRPPHHHRGRPNQGETGASRTTARAATATTIYRGRNTRSLRSSLWERPQRAAI